MKKQDKNTTPRRSALRLLEAFSGVDEELLVRSGFATGADAENNDEKVTYVSGYDGRRRRIIYGRVAAACLALLAVGAISWNALRLSHPKGSDHAMSDVNNYDSGTSNFEQTAGGANAQTQDGNQEKVTSSTNFTGNPEISSGEDLGQPDEKGLQTDQTDGSSRGEGTDSGATPEEVDMEICSIPPDVSQELTEKEARNVAVFGDYIPEKLPRGYTFSGAWSSGESVTVSWTRGMDYIMISVSMAMPEDMESVDVEQTEAYDVWLYEVPYAETVPAQFRQVFDHPLFAAEDMSLEVVKRRMKTYEDAGDTATPRGDFSILYPDGVMVRFNGRGTAEEIWSMFDSLKKQQ